MGRLSLHFLVSLIFLAFSSGCASIENFLNTLEGGTTTRHAASDASDELAVYDDGVPRIRPGVMMLVQVGAGSQQAISMQVQVDQSGQITLQYLLNNPVLCNGLTLEALKQKLTKAYQRYIKQPVVTVSFLPVDGKNGVSPYGFVTVLGEVAQPGPVNMPATMDLTVTKALQLAGGLRPFADKSSIRVTSCDKDGNKKRTVINLREIGQEGLIDKDITLRAGDVVWVPETWY